MTDEQKHAVEHAQKVLRAVKLYDLAAILVAPTNELTDLQELLLKRIERAVAHLAASMGGEPK